MGGGGGTYIDHHPHNPPLSPGPAPPTICFGRILLGEVTPLLAAMKRSAPRWSSHQQGTGQDSLVDGLREVREVVGLLRDGDTLDPNTFLHPFLAVIRSEDTTGPVTKTALAAVNRMLVYGLVWEGQDGASSAVEAIAGAVTHARFVGTDQGADEVVLWEILTVLRTLMLGGAGRLLTNEAVCEILNSAFRICFEPRLSELLRTCTEDALTHMVQLLFSRLPLFADHAHQSHTRRLKMRAAGQTRGKRGSDTPTPPPPPPPPPTHTHTDTDNNNTQLDDDEDKPINSPVEINYPQEAPKESTDTPLTPDDPPPQQQHTENTQSDATHTHHHEATVGTETDGSKCSRVTHEQQQQQPQQQQQQEETRKDVLTVEDLTSETFTNSQGVKFEGDGGGVDVEGVAGGGGGGVLVPHGAACVREVLRFLVSLTAPTNEQNTPAMTLTALNLLTAGLEIGAAEVGRRAGLLALVADPLCHHLLGLLRGEGRVGLAVFGAATRLTVLLVESLRHRLKFQVEALLARLAHVATEEGPGAREGHRELALEALAQLWGGAGLAGQVYLNYDCDLYCSDVFEDITRTLANTTFPSGPDPAALTALAALMAVVNDIRDRNQPNPAPYPLPAPVTQTNTLCQRCPLAPVLVARAGVGEGVRTGRAEAWAIKQRKKTLLSGTEQFNNKPDKGLKTLQEAGAAGRTPEDVATFLRHNPRICKRALGDYLSRKKNVEILAAFVCTFHFTGQRVDESLRVFLESFRLPGEAPLISAVIEHFAAHWHHSNGQPFVKEDAAFTLAYAIIMLNVDQHSPAARRQNIPMTLGQFTNNLRGVNGGSDFDPLMLEAVYNAIKKDEIVMPAEHAGRVREDYQWRLLLRRAATSEARFLLPATPNDLDRDLFLVCWGPTVAALSCVLDRGGEAEAGRAVAGFGGCGAVAARLGLVEVLDNLVATLCKFTGLDAVDPPEQLASAFAASRRAQLAAGAAVGLAAGHGDGLRDAWANVVQLLLQLFRCRLLPQSLVTSPDPLASGGQVCLLPQPPAPPRPEAGLLSSLYSYISMSDGGAGRGVEEGAGLGAGQGVRRGNPTGASTRRIHIPTGRLTGRVTQGHDRGRGGTSRGGAGRTGAGRGPHRTTKASYWSYRCA
ncbi:hypothetical protein Pcinc_042986 [Petrolisthes cinctipes]|uniref:SEC7 domain-containing protein n=1 Tax=Petrolisthes cinctipes TaxID=88211 RepID=A0AAE1BK18_PETCI|nr:hypothetical protein Pcinc_042986 [Petrolisthes cinctipes]